MRAEEDLILGPATHDSERLKLVIDVEWHKHNSTNTGGLKSEDGEN